MDTNPQLTAYLQPKKMEDVIDGGTPDVRKQPGTRIEQFFDALTEQTRRRGGSPSVRNISDVALDVQTVLSCYSQVREQAVVPGMDLGLARAIEAMDSAVEKLNRF